MIDEQAFESVHCSVATSGGHSESVDIGTVLPLFYVSRECLRSCHLGNSRDISPGFWQFDTVKSHIGAESEENKPALGASREQLGQLFLLPVLVVLDKIG